MPGRGADQTLTGLVLAGSLFQALLVIILWLRRPGSQERMALAASYRALSQYAARLAAGVTEPPPQAAFPAHTAIDDPNPLLPWAVRLTFVNLLEQAERIRASLAALSAHTAASGQPQHRELMADAVRALGLIADALSAGRGQRLITLRELRRILSQRSVPPDASWRWAGEALLGQLRAVRRITARLEVTHLSAASAGMAASPPRDQGVVAATLMTLRANVSKSSEAGRHALRLAVIATLAEAIVQAVGLFQGRWVTLTIFLVLKPDYTSTVYRGVQRAVGTILGAGLSAVVVALAHPGQVGLIAAAGLCIAAGYALFDVRYLLFSVALTGFILALLDLMGSPGLVTAEARLLDTFIGSAFAIAAYFAWPTWEGVAAPEKFARLLEAHREYATALLRELGHPGSVDPAELRLRQTAARRARSEAEAATERLSDEPVRPPLTPPIARALIAAVARLAHAELALHALALSAGQTAGTQDASAEIAHIDVLNNAIDVAMDRLVVALRTLAPPQAFLHFVRYNRHNLNARKTGMVLLWGSPIRSSMRSIPWTISCANTCRSPRCALPADHRSKGIAVEFVEAMQAQQSRPSSREGVCSCISLRMAVAFAVRFVTRLPVCQLRSAPATAPTASAFGQLILDQSPLPNCR
jgi:uncharacterized membrane protein YccC